MPGTAIVAEQGNHESRPLPVGLLDHHETEATTPAEPLETRAPHVPCGDRRCSRRALGVFEVEHEMRSKEAAQDISRPVPPLYLQQPSEQSTAELPRAPPRSGLELWEGPDRQMPERPAGFLGRSSTRQVSSYRINDDGGL